MGRGFRKSAVCVCVGGWVCDMYVCSYVCICVYQRYSFANVHACTRISCRMYRMFVRVCARARPGVYVRVCARVYVRASVCMAIDVGCATRTESDVARSCWSVGYVVSQQPCLHRPSRSSRFASQILLVCKSGASRAVCYVPLTLVVGHGPQPSKCPGSPVQWR